jgi:hypothetical protein
MKFTRLYLKWLAVILLAVVVLFTGAGLVWLVPFGIISLFATDDPKCLVLVFVGIFCGFSAAVATDCLEYLLGKWRI